MNDLTHRQEFVLSVYLAYGKEYGRWPTLRTLLEMTGIRSLNGIMCHLRALIRKGHLRPVRKALEQHTYEPVGCEFRLWFDSSPEGQELAKLAHSVDVEQLLEVSR